MNVTIRGGKMSQTEIDEYIRRLRKKHPDRIIKHLTLTVTVKAKCKKTQKKPELKETKKVPIIRANCLFDLHFDLA